MERLSLMNVVDTINNNDIHYRFECHYTQYYVFGECFFSWWKKSFDRCNRTSSFATEKEELLIENFYKKHIEPSKDIITDTTYL